MRPPGISRSPAVLALVLLAGAHTPAAAQTGATRLTLIDALEAAFASHPAIRAVSARQSSAAQREAESNASRWPTVALQYGVTRFEEPMVTTPIHAFDPNQFPAFDRTLAQGNLGLRYTVIDWGARAAARDGAAAGVGFADSGARLARMQLIEAVSAAYLDLASARAINAAADARVEALDEEVARVRQGVDAGTAAEVELLRATTARQDAIAQQTATRAGVVRAERDLARLTGSEDTRIRSAALADPTSLEPAALSAATAGNEDPVVEDHPLVDQAVRAAAAARAVVGAEKSGRLPRLDLNGAMLDYGTLSDEHVFEWQVGAQLSWTLFSGGQRTSAIRRAEADLRAAEADIASRTLDVQAAEDAARTAVDAADARVDALDTAVQQWEELVRIERLALDAGAGTQRDLLHAQAGLFNARAGRSRAYADATVSRIRLASAQGVLTLDWIQDFMRRSQ